MNTENSPSHSADITVQCESIEPPSWLSDYQRFLERLLIHQGYSDWELSVLLTNDDTIQRYNREYRSLDYPTDVLSFSQNEGAGIPAMNDIDVAGDILISLETVRRNAEEFGTTPNDELRRVSIHGILHLAGYVHHTNSIEQEPMLRLQEHIMTEMDKELLF